MAKGTLRALGSRLPAALGAALAFCAACIPVAGAAGSTSCKPVTAVVGGKKVSGCLLYSRAGTGPITYSPNIGVTGYGHVTVTWRYAFNNAKHPHFVVAFSPTEPDVVTRSYQSVTQDLSSAGSGAKRLDVRGLRALGIYVIAYDNDTKKASGSWSVRVVGERSQGEGRHVRVHPATRQIIGENQYGRLRMVL